MKIFTPVFTYYRPLSHMQCVSMQMSNSGTFSGLKLLAPANVRFSSSNYGHDSEQCSDLILWTLPTVHVWKRLYIHPFRFNRHRSLSHTHTQSTYVESLKCAITMLFLFTVVCVCVHVCGCGCVFLFIHVRPSLLLARLLPSSHPPHRNYSHGWGCRH